MSRSDENKTFGEKLSKLRTKHNISLEELSEKSGLQMEYLKRVEEGRELPPVGDILKLSRLLTVDPADLLPGQNKGEIRKKRISDFKKREDSYFYRVLTPDAKNRHLRAFRVTIPPKSEHPRINYSHEGEEFIYVLSGVVEITVGKKKHLLKKNESLHFDSGINHSLKNTGGRETLLIVTIYTP